MVDQFIYPSCNRARDVRAVEQGVYMNRTILAAAAASLAVAVATPVMAAQRFDFTYSCSTVTTAGCAKVTGSFDLDHSGNTLKAGDYATYFTYGTGVGPISNVNAIVSGARSGNGAFGPSDFQIVTFNTISDLDLSKELVGQNGFGVDKFGGSDFNLFASAGSAAPSGVLFNNQLATNGGLGDGATLKSLRLAPVAAAVPEPATWMSMILGFGLIGAAMRRGATGRAGGRAVAA